MYLHCRRCPLPAEDRGQHLGKSTKDVDAIDPRASKCTCGPQRRVLSEARRHRLRRRLVLHDAKRRGIYDKKIIPRRSPMTNALFSSRAVWRWLLMPTTTGLTGRRLLQVTFRERQLYATPIVSYGSRAAGHGRASVGQSMPFARGSDRPSPAIRWVVLPDAQLSAPPS